MDNNAADKTPGMVAAEKTAILDGIQNYMATSTTDTRV